MEKRFSIYFAAALLLSFTAGAFAWESGLVHYSGGKLVYVSDAENNRIPDFSYAGYKGGCEPIPNVPVIRTISPVSGDNTSNIQSAIDWAGSQPLVNGIRGAVKLNPGKYEVYDRIYLKYSGVVLRGSGSGNNPAVDSIIYGVGNNPVQRTLVRLGGGSGTGWGGKVAGSQQNITDNYLQVGSKAFTVADDAPFNAGDNIVIFHPSTQAWLDAIKGGEPGSDPLWAPGQIDIKYNTYIKSIDRVNNKITTESPIFEHFNRSLSQAYVYKYDRAGLLTNIGIEDLRVDNDYASDTDENHVWQSIDFLQLEDGWADNVTAIHFGQSGFRLMTSSRVTIQNCNSLDPKSITTGERKYNFNFSSNCSNILVRDSHASLGRHNFISNGTSSVGGIVVYNCTVTQDLTTSEGHRFWTTGMLFDNYRQVGTVSLGMLGFYNRGDWGTSHGWAASHCVAWNCDFKASYMYLEKPPTSQNYAIGCKSTSGDPVRIGPFKKSLGYEEGTNVTGLNPPSLYLAQVAERICPGSTATYTRTRTPVPVNTPTFTRTRTATPANTKTNTPQPTKTFTASFTKTSTVVNTATFTAVNTKTRTPTLTATRTLTLTFTQTATRTPSPSLTITETSSCSSTPSKTPTLTLTLTSYYSFTPTLTFTQPATRTPSPSLTLTSTRTFTLTPANTMTSTPANTKTYTPTLVYTSTLTPVNTITSTPENTKTYTPTLVYTSTLTPDSTLTSTPANTKTYTPTLTYTGTLTPVNTMTSTSSATRTPSPSFTMTITITSYYSFTPTLTVTIPSTSTPTPSLTMTFSRTSTATFVNTPTATATLTAIPDSELTIIDALAFPNPVIAGSGITFRLNIRGSNAAAHIRIYTVAGRLVRQFGQAGLIDGENDVRVTAQQLSGLSAGSYYYEAKLVKNGFSDQEKGVFMLLR